MICIILAIIIILILFIIIYNKEKFNDYISSNHSILDNYSYHDLGLINRIIDPITGAAQSRYTSCKEGTGKKEEEDKSSQGSQKKLEDWFQKNDVKGSKIKCPNNDKTININDICKKDDWYTDCLSGRDQTRAITEGSKFCLHLCKNDNHHLRRKNQNAQQSSSGPPGEDWAGPPPGGWAGPPEGGWGGLEGGWGEPVSSDSMGDGFDICQFVDPNNGRPWFAQKIGTGDNETRKCPSSDIYINRAKICRPGAARGLYMGDADNAPSLEGRAGVSESDVAEYEKKKEFYFFCKNKENSKPNWSIDEVENIKFPVGSDAFCCPKVKLTYENPAMYLEQDNSSGSGSTPLSDNWEVPILNHDFCTHIWKGKMGQDSDVDTEDQDHAQELYD